MFRNYLHLTNLFSTNRPATGYWTFAWRVFCCGLVLFCLLTVTDLIGTAFFDDAGNGLVAPVFGQDAVQGNVDGNAQGEGTGNEVLPPRKRSFLVYFVQSLGFSFGLTFLVLSVWDVALIMINVFAIRRPAIMPAPLVEQFTTLLDNKQYQEAYELAKESDSFIGKVLAAGLAKINCGYEAMQKSMQDVGDEELMTMEHRLSLLALIANISPMIGLLGTVVGMVESFQVIANSQSAPQASKLAEGVSTALVTTEVGLFIAIPSIVAYDILKNMLAKSILEVTFVTDNLMNRFK